MYTELPSGNVDDSDVALETYEMELEDDDDKEDE